MNELKREEGVVEKKYSKLKRYLLLLILMAFGYSLFGTVGLLLIALWFLM